MFKINSYTDLKVAYEILEIAYESGRSQKAVDLKREMRAFFHRPVSERRIVQDDGIDGYTELLPLPQSITLRNLERAHIEDGLHPTAICDYAGPFIRLTTEE